jgi:K+-transporting ATPase KdpF subunit
VILYQDVEIRRSVNVGDGHVRSDIHRADGGDLCAARPDTEVGREPVSQNMVGLILAVLLALFLFAALLFPERF